MTSLSGLKSIGVFIGIRLFGAGATFAAVTLVSRHWSTGSSDRFVFLLAVMVVARIVAPLGIEQHIFRTISKQTYNRNLLLSSLFPYLLKSTTLQSLLVGVLLYKVNLGFSLALQSAVIWGFCALVAVNSAILRSLDRKIQSQLPEAVIVPILLLAYLLLGGNLAEIVMVSVVMSAVSGVGLVWKLPDSVHPEERPFSRFSQLTYLPAAVASITIVLAVKGPIFLATSLLPPGSATALDVAARPALIASLITTAMGQFLSPQIAQTIEKRDVRATTRYCIRGGIVAGVWGLLAICALVLAGPDMFSTLFGARYGSSWQLAIAYSVAITVNSFFSLFSVALTLEGAGYYTATANAINLICVSTGLFLASHSGRLLDVALAALVGACAREALVLGTYIFRQRSGATSG